MSLKAKLAHEIRMVGTYTAFFGAWVLLSMIAKSLVLAEYRISGFNLSTALIGALILAKVVLVMEHVPVAGWLRRRAAWLVVVERTVLCGFGVVVVLLIEKAIEVRHEQGGILSALLGVLHHKELPHVLATALSVTGALLVFNSLTVIKRHLGDSGLLKMFVVPLPPAREGD